MRAVRSFTKRSARTSISPEGGCNIPDKRDSRLTISYRRASGVTVEYSVIGILDKLLVASVETAGAFPLLYINRYNYKNRNKRNKNKYIIR